MKNVKSIITLKPVYGLHKDAVLTRENSESNFVYETEYAGKDHSYSNKVSLSESLIDREHFSAIEWFEEKPLTNKQKIEALTEENKNLKLEIEKLKSNDLKSKVDSAIAEYQKEFDRVYKLQDGLYGYEQIDFANEAMTVYDAIITAMKKLTNE